MWTDFIKWRTDNRVDELYESFDYHELKEVDKFYPKFYHKTDKVSLPSGRRGWPKHLALSCR